MIHINIGSNLDSKYGTRFDNITIAVQLLVQSNIEIKKISILLPSRKILLRNRGSDAVEVSLVG